MEDPLFDRYGVDGVMPNDDSDGNSDVPSSSGGTQQEGGYGGNDENWQMKFEITSCSRCL